MQDFMDAVVFGFKEVLNFRKMKIALLGGTIISVFWILVGIVFWDSIVSFSTMFLDLVPFSLIRSNGAWMLSTFLWLQLVLVTFALFFAFLVNILLANKTQHGFYALNTMIASALFWSAIWYFQGDYIHAQMLQFLTWLPFKTIASIVSSLMGFYFIYSLIILSNLFLASAMSGKTLDSVKERHFPYDSFLEENEVKTLSLTLKDTGIFIGVSIVAFPLLFIPVVNFFIQVALWVWLMKDTSFFDSASYFIKDAKKENIKEYRTAIWSISALGSLFNFIPVLNILAPYFTQISMFAYLKEQK